MRKVRVLAAEAASKIEMTQPYQAGLLLHREPVVLTIIEGYFGEIKEGLSESRVLHPAKEQVDFIFKESDDRWVQFCRKLVSKIPQIILNEDAFSDWANGIQKPVLITGGK